LVTGYIGLNVPQIIEIEKLRSLPVGTFGRSWSDFLDRNNLQPLSTGARRKQIHDGIHVLTGYDTDPIGEAQIQMFLLGAKFNPAHVVLLTGLMLPIWRQQSAKSSKKPLGQSKSSIHQILWQAFYRGRQSGFDVDRWQPELLWELPLTQVQKLSNL